MRLKLFKLLLISVPLFAYDSDILSEEQKQSLLLNKESIVKDSKRLENEWLSPITYTYTYNDNKLSGVTKKSTIAINQAIFRSGGIYYGIQYAKNLRESSILSIELQKKLLIKQALNIAYNIKKVELQIKQQKFVIDNAKVDLKIKKESVLNGLLDTSFLNNAVLTLNNQKASFLELEYTREKLLNDFKNLSNKSIDELELPVLKQIEQKDFENNHLELKRELKNIDVQKNFSDGTKSKYLPSIHFQYSKEFDHKRDINNDNLGFNVVVPFDIKTFYDIDSAKATYLKAKKDFKILEQSEINFFKTQNLKLKMLDAKIDLTKENINSLNQLLRQMYELYTAGIKSKEDVFILQNSKKSEALTIQILEYEKQMVLLEMYGKIVNDKI